MRLDNAHPSFCSVFLSLLLGHMPETSGTQLLNSHFMSTSKSGVFSSKLSSSGMRS
jgi:hypothetical protein